MNSILRILKTRKNDEFVILASEDSIIQGVSKVFLFFLKNFEPIAFKFDNTGCFKGISYIFVKRMKKNLWNTLYNRILESQNHKFVVLSGFEDSENQMCDSGFPWNNFREFDFRRIRYSGNPLSVFRISVKRNSNSTNWPVISYCDWKIVQNANIHPY